MKNKGPTLRISAESRSLSTAVAASLIFFSRSTTGPGRSAIRHLLPAVPHRLGGDTEPQNGESSGVFIDDNSILTIGKNFRTTGTMLRGICTRDGGIDQWAASHNCIAKVADVLAN